MGAVSNGNVPEASAAALCEKKLAIVKQLVIRLVSWRYSHCAECLIMEYLGERAIEALDTADPVTLERLADVDTLGQEAIAYAKSELGRK